MKTAESAAARSAIQSSPAAGESSAPGVARVLRQRFSVDYTFPVYFTHDAFDPGNPVLADAAREGGGSRRRVLVVLDSGVIRVTPGLTERIRRYTEAHRETLELAAPPFVVRGGEVCKREPLEVDRIHALVERHGLCRHSFVIVVGGGAVLDAAGYAAATAHRGVRLIRLPTTVLAQNDAGIGVKNAINAFGRKNFLGTFAPPFAVINDFSFLGSLPERELRAGIAEAVKVALIRDPAFFEALEEGRADLARFASEPMERMIVRCAEIHLDHICKGGDPFERASSRPLDFGHWAAHKLEELTGGELNHGEAVAVGIALDSSYSRARGLLAERELERILTLLEGLGFCLYHPALAALDVPKALNDFQEHLGGSLAIPLLERIGRQVEVAEIDLPLMHGCIAALAARTARKGVKR